MHETHAEFFKNPVAHFLRHLGGVAKLRELLARFDQWIDDERLMLFAQLARHRFVDCASLLRIVDLRANRFPSGWQLIEKRYLEIAVEYHGETARYRRRAHE